MDLLFVPDKSTLPLEKAPYVASDDQRWDGGAFLTYASRIGRMRIIPFEYRELVSKSTVGSESSDILRQDQFDDQEPFLDYQNPIPPREKESIFQTWFFFGLAAELLGLNEPSPGQKRPIDPTYDHKQELEDLYAKCVVNEDGTAFLSGADILRSQGLMQNRILLQMKLGTSLEDRIDYLHTCLRFTQNMITRLSKDVQQTIALSIAALGELGTAIVNSFLLQPALVLDSKPLGLAWHNVLGIEDQLEFSPLAMLQNGWCPSDIGRMFAHYDSLNTIYYLSRLQRSGNISDHASCNSKICLRGQINLETYKPTHTRPGCKCDLFHVEIDAVQEILAHTESFPVLKFESDTGSEEEWLVTVEKHTPGTPFVALSHVWADGLGNPSENAIRRCQIDFLAGLLVALQDSSNSLLGYHSTESVSKVNRIEYRFWLDTLCCPVELTGKKIALERIKDVYSAASHVLVLDSCFSTLEIKEMHTMEALMRTFGSSAWMRRLWTLQEASLSKSLLFQFKDRAVNPFKLLEEIFGMIFEDARYHPVMTDFRIELIQMHGFLGNTSKSYDSGIGWGNPDLSIIQRALMFRSVTVPEDEPLCIATLLSLDVKNVLAVDNLDERMARVWDMWVRKTGSVPSRLVFSIEEGLRKRGWGWAPRSLLSSLRTVPRYPHVELGTSAKIRRFVRNGSGNESGLPTAHGLRVQFSGGLICPVARIEGMKLHLWERLMLSSGEHRIPLFQETVDEGTGTVSRKWFKMDDAYRALTVSAWTTEEREKYDREANWPLHHAIDSGPHALIFEPELDPETEYGSKNAVLVRVNQALTAEENGEHNENALYVQHFRRVLLSRLSPIDPLILVYETVRELSIDLARDEATEKFLKAKAGSVEELDAARASLRLRAIEIMEEAFKTREGFGQAVDDAMGPNMREYMAATIPQWFAHDIKLQRLPASQIWIVD